MRCQPPPIDRIREQVTLALDEDIGTGDLTAALIPEASLSGASVVCREEAVICGTPWFDEVYRQLAGARVSVHWRVEDGDRVAAGTEVCRLEGETRALLSGERTALNYLQTLSGTATLARRFADAVAGTGVRILDTRKTIPGLRLQQKYAVACGGCHNHRIGLYDAILIKENHIAAAGSVTAALERAQARSPRVEVEVEVEDMAQLHEALAAGARRVLLDNFSTEALEEAVAVAKGRARLEASGGVELSSLLELARTGVDDISIGALTKNVRAVDLSMRFD